MRRNNLILVLVVLLLTIGALVYVHLNFSKTGILLNHGLSKENIKLTTENGNTKFYFYEKNKEIGLLAMRKRNGPGWIFYTDNRILIDDKTGTIKTVYPTIKNGAAVARSVWGGVVKDATSANIIVKINGMEYQPNLLTYKKNDSLYFLIDTDKVDKSDFMTIELQ
ncbi:hypothetical protein ACFOQM_01775 [Paenibacillus sp. GCM10012307]|uniref:Uncharacterized protein n=1 Tax=Paenibacillus roseus TaxID=2798579 RepID=A0A934J237_9BACL|nr:hypothetical protein [Paenibacillus roseus]MBJ6360048.1 hypothetical protein [Paenibacillus roseus]